MDVSVVWDMNIEVKMILECLGIIDLIVKISEFFGG